MIVRERVAICEGAGCGSRTLVEEEVHPKTWPAMIDASGTHYFCSHACLRETAGLSFPPRKRLPPGITEKDVDLLILVGQGYMNGEIAAHLDLALSTVKNRLCLLYAQLHAPTRIEALLRAHHLGLLNLNVLAERCNARLERAA